MPKTVREGMTLGNIMLGQPNFSGAKLLSANENGLAKIVIDTNNVENGVTDKCCLWSKYTVNIANGAIGKQLIYSGSIQPSDYKEANEYGLTNISKYIQVIVLSKNAFKASIYEPSENVFFPESHKVVTHDKQLDNNMYKFEKLAVRDHTQSHRARYFTVVAKQWW